ncbi:hypothetical protein MKZ26_16200 [Sporosarcina sp. FSL K6-6792]|uniref:hypothetical protein n=1 Tax=Sporosarcina sp. FSL K6-6792 TaxID=2921559 RepID=UPI0030F9B88C
MSRFALVHFRLALDDMITTPFPPLPLERNCNSFLLGQPVATICPSRNYNVQVKNAVVRKKRIDDIL